MTFLVSLVTRYANENRLQRTKRGDGHNIMRMTGFICLSAPPQHVSIDNV